METRAHARIGAGICGFTTSVTATAEQGRLVELLVDSDCETIVALAAAIHEHGAFDAYDEIDPRTDGALLPLVHEYLHGCCSGCACPVGMFKAMLVAAGLALPKDIVIEMSKDDAGRA